MSAEVPYTHPAPERSTQVRMISALHEVIRAQNKSRQRQALPELTLSTLDPADEPALAHAAQLFVDQTVERSVDCHNHARSQRLAHAYEQGRIVLLHTVVAPEVITHSLDEYYRLQATAEPQTHMAYRAHYVQRARQQAYRFPEIALGMQLAATLHEPHYYSVARVAANASTALVTAYGRSLDALQERDKHGIIRRFDIPKGN